MYVADDSCTTLPAGRTWKPEELRRPSPVDGRMVARGDHIEGIDEDGRQVRGIVNEVGAAGFWIGARFRLDPFILWENDWRHTT